MGLIDIGPGAIERSAGYGGNKTAINLNNPSNDTGILDTIEAWAYSNIFDAKIGTFSGSGSTYDDRDYTSIGAIYTGAKRTITGLSIDVNTGDFLGAFFATGTIMRIASGYSGLYERTGDSFGSGSKSYSFLSGDALSIYGTGATTQLEASYSAQTFRAVTVGSAYSGQSKRVLNSGAGYSGQTTRIVKSASTFIGQTFRQIIAPAGYTGQTSRAVTSIVGFIGQTIRQVISAAGYAAQTARITTLLTSYSGQTVRVLNSVASYIGQGKRAITLSANYTGQTLRTVLSAVAFAGQAQRIIKSVVSFSGQTERKATTAAAYIAQTIRTVGLSALFTAQTSRTIIALSAYTAQTLRQLSALASFTGQNKRSVISAAAYIAQTLRRIQAIAVAQYIGSTIRYVILTPVKWINSQNSQRSGSAQAGKRTNTIDYSAKIGEAGNSKQSGDTNFADRTGDITGNTKEQ